MRGIAGGFTIIYVGEVICVTDYEYKLNMKRILESESPLTDEDNREKEITRYKIQSLVKVGAITAAVVLLVIFITIL